MHSNIPQLQPDRKTPLGYANLVKIAFPREFYPVRWDPATITTRTQRPSNPPQINVQPTLHDLTNVATPPITPSPPTTPTLDAPDQPRTAHEQPDAPNVAGPSSMKPLIKIPGGGHPSCSIPLVKGPEEPQRPRKRLKTTLKKSKGD